MSLGYAEKLSYREDLGGQLGAKELFDKPTDLRGDTHKLKQLVRSVWISPAVFLVIIDCQPECALGPHRFETARTSLYSLARV